MTEVTPLREPLAIPEERVLRTDHGLVQHPFVSVSIHLIFFSPDFLLFALFHNLTPTIFLHSAIDCGPLPAPDDGSVSITSTRVDATATYRCNNGFVLTGASIRTCLLSGQWSGQAPTCERQGNNIEYHVLVLELQAVTVIY